MFDSDAEAIFPLIIEDSVFDRWLEDVNGYPEMIRSVLWLSAKRVALEWITENKPEAFYRPLFEEE